ncbi:MAG: recombinase family protein [Glaciimonas sp.]|nr:recombinase family protein [Glaciimonas sp.]
MPNGSARIDNKISGSRAERPGLNKALEVLHEGDTLATWKLDRVGRSVKNLVELVGALAKHLGVLVPTLYRSIPASAQP